MPLVPAIDAAMLAALNFKKLRLFTLSSSCTDSRQELALFLANVPFTDGGLPYRAENDKRVGGPGTCRCGNKQQERLW